MAKFHRKTVTGYDTIGSGLLKVVHASTPEALGASSVSIKGIVIKSLAGNTDIVVVGGSNVTATPTGSPIGVVLAATGEMVELKTDNLSKIYVAVAVDGEGVSYTYYN